MLALARAYISGAPVILLDYAYILGRGRITFAGDASELVDEDVFHRYLGIEVGAGAHHTM
jgi:ABC-type lipopolysaccharide export system ATPase subunit